MPGSLTVGIACVGSRGDVQPYVALGQGLRRAGHDVRIIADASFHGLVRAAGLELVPVGADPGPALREDLHRIADNPVRLMRWFGQHLRPLARQYFTDVNAAAAGADGLLFSTLALAAPHVAEALRIPCLAAYLQPVSPTRAFASPAVPHVPRWIPFRSHVNWLSFRLGSIAFFRLLRGVLNDCRRDVLGLPPLPWRHYRTLDLSSMPILYGYSRFVVPKPLDWGEWLHVTGYWFADADVRWEAPAELAAFLRDGPPPVYVGFGSMGGRDAAVVADLASSALGPLAMRGILLGSADGPPVRRLSDTVITVRSVPHDWLFPQCAAVVHHGGAGTTATGLRAGVPTATVPYFADQFFWAARVHELGVGAGPIPRSGLNAARLAETIRTATGDDRIRLRSAELGQRIRTEDGVARAVALIEQLLGG